MFKDSLSPVQHFNPLSYWDSIYRKVNTKTIPDIIVYPKIVAIGRVIKESDFLLFFLFLIVIQELAWAFVLWSF